MKNKTLLNTMKKGYFKLPDKLRSIGVSSDAIALYVILATHKEDFDPPQTYMAKLMGWSRNHLRKIYSELETRNMIRCIHKGYKNVTKKYEFTSPEVWV